MSPGTSDQQLAADRALNAAKRRWGDGWRPQWRAEAPGRIELLGNHLDYNGGPVLAAAIDRTVTVLVGSGGPTDQIELLLPDFARDDETIPLDPSALGDWRHDAPPSEPADFIRGLLAAALARSRGLRLGSRVVISGDIPVGFGVSSSAALCVAAALALTEPKPYGTDLILMAQEAEHRAGTPCGTMDQAASVAGGVIRYDAATLRAEALRPDLGEHVFLVIDSGVDRSLGHSVYPDRVREMAFVLETARDRLGRDIQHVADLADADVARLSAPSGPLESPLTERLQHIVTEKNRVAEGVRRIAESDWITFGGLMTASGRSSAGDYDVSHPRVEELVAETLTVRGILGARMMGGGGGGTVLALARQDMVTDLRRHLNHGYLGRYGLAQRADAIQVCQFAPGASAAQW